MTNNVMKCSIVTCREGGDLQDVQHFDGCRRSAQLGVFFARAWTELTLVSLNFPR